MELPRRRDEERRVSSGKQGRTVFQRSTLQHGEQLHYNLRRCFPRNNYMGLGLILSDNRHSFMTALTEPTHATLDDTAPDTAAWKRIVVEYQNPSLGRAVWQITNTLGPLALLWYLMYLSLSVSWWLTIPLAMVTGALLIRVFIIFHDCGHGSYFKSRIANDTVGFITGMLTLTPYHQWRCDHATHHATSGHMDKRGIADLWTLTVHEYLESTRWQRPAYRLARNPFVSFVLAPLYLFLIRPLFPAANDNNEEPPAVYSR